MNRVYVEYEKLEEVKYGMWSDVNDLCHFTDLAHKLLKDYVLLGEVMIDVVNSWKFSCINALTDELINQRAWLGQAACAYKYNIPEDLTRKAWSRLTKNEKLLANKQADRAIEYWNENYWIKSKKLSGSMEEQMLLKWNP